MRMRHRFSPPRSRATFKTCGIGYFAATRRRILSPLVSVLVDRRPIAPLFGNFAGNLLSRNPGKGIGNRLDRSRLPFALGFLPNPALYLIDETGLTGPPLEPPLGVSFAYAHAGGNFFRFASFKLPGGKRIEVFALSLS